MLALHVAGLLAAPSALRSEVARRAQSAQLGTLTVCIIQAENLENLDTNEVYGGEASDP